MHVTYVGGWGIPDDLPVDIWTNEYAQYGRSDHYRIPTHQEIGRQQWLKAGSPEKPKQFFWYSAAVLLTPPHSRLTVLYHCVLSLPQK